MILGVRVVIMSLGQDRITTYASKSFVSNKVTITIDLIVCDLPFLMISLQLDVYHYITEIFVVVVLFQTFSYTESTMIYNAQSIFNASPSNKN
jgi:hypothetical protein